MTDDVSAGGKIKSLSARRAWIEITGRSVEFHLFASLSARRAWIEIRVVDGSKSSIEVALRKESVDRNGLGFCYFRDDVSVALRKESVDRNNNFSVTRRSVIKSLSARRAWIEIITSV